MVDFGALSTKIGKGLQKVFGSANERMLTGFKPMVQKVNELEEWAQGMDETAVKARVAEWKEKVQSGAVFERDLPAKAKPGEGTYSHQERGEHPAK